MGAQKLKVLIAMVALFAIACTPIKRPVPYSSYREPEPAPVVAKAKEPAFIKDDEDRECYRIGFKPKTKEFTACKYRLVIEKNERRQRAEELRYQAEMRIYQQELYQLRQAGQQQIEQGLNILNGR